MNKIIYNKLVRDNIPDIIQKSGDECKITILDDREYAKALADKLAEEQLEFLHAFVQEDDEKAILELADVVEVCYAVLDFIGVTYEDFEKIRENKAVQNGKFNNRIFLREVIKQSD